MSSFIMDDDMLDARYQEAKRITIIGAFVNALLGVVKLVGGLLFHSHALFADGVHSFSDLLIDVMVLIASRFGSLDADETHPYGHQRIETAATLLLALLLILAGIAIAWDGVNELLHHSFVKPLLYAIPIAIFSIIANELLFYFTHHTGKKLRSSLLIANAWHHRSDSLASLVVVFGLVGSLFGLLYLDAIAAIIVAFMIIKMGFTYGWESTLELIDTAAEIEMRQEIENTLMAFDGIEKIHQLRTRLMGGDIFIDLHILVAPDISVSEGHYIAQQVHYTLLKRFERIKDVTVHVDPEDDETFCPSMHLPSRKAINDLFLSELQADFPFVKKVLLHYLEGTLSIDFIVKEANPHDLETLASLLKTIPLNFPFITSVRLQSEIACFR